MRQYILEEQYRTTNSVSYIIYENAGVNSVSASFRVCGNLANQDIAEIQKNIFSAKKGVDYDGYVHNKTGLLVGAVHGTEFVGLVKLQGRCFTRKQNDPKESKYEYLASFFDPTYLPVS